MTMRRGVISSEAAGPGSSEGAGQGGAVARSGARAPIGVGLLGCGTVGGGVLRLLAENAPRLEDRIGAPLEVRRVLVRDLTKPRVPECQPGWLTTSPDEVLEDPAVDLIVEVMGGEGDARAFIERALRKGKGVV